MIKNWKVEEKNNVYEKERKRIYLQNKNKNNNNNNNNKWRERQTCLDEIHFVLMGAILWYSDRRAELPAWRIVSSSSVEVLIVKITKQDDCARNGGRALICPAGLMVCLISHQPPVIKLLSVKIDYCKGEVIADRNG